MASSKPQGYYICPLKALRESSSQSSEEEWIKVTRPICFRPGHKYFWGTVRLFLCPVSSALTDATRAAVHNSQCLWLHNKGTDKWASRTRLEEWTRKKKDCALQYKPGTKSNIQEAFLINGLDWEPMDFTLYAPCSLLAELASTHWRPLCPFLLRTDDQFGNFPHSVPLSHWFRSPSP